jgi:hypothetical protein
VDDPIGTSEHINELPIPAPAASSNPKSAFHGEKKPGYEGSASSIEEVDSEDLMSLTVGQFERKSAADEHWRPAFPKCVGFLLIGWHGNTDIFLG